MIKLLAVIALIVTIAGGSRADETASPKDRAKLEQLLAMTSRPTIADLQKTLQPWPSANPLSGYVSAQMMLNSARMTNDIKNKLPEFIAGLEFTFRGGTYAFLGRDSVWLADAVDAFYRAHGQIGRVVRLNASSDSFALHHSMWYKPLTKMSPEKMSLILDFLSANGLDIDHVDQNPPYVIIDSTKYNVSSQSRLLLTIFYRAFHKQTGRPFKDLVRKVNVLNTYRLFRKDITWMDRYRTYFAEQEARADEDGPTEILQLVIGPPPGQQWHGPFGPFQRDPDGRAITPPGEVNGRQQRELILADLIEIKNFVSSPEFYQSVKEAAKADFGYDFPELHAKSPSSAPAEGALSAPAEPLSSESAEALSSESAEALPTEPNQTVRPESNPTCDETLTHPRENFN